jgi:NitT/TauT family transport system ATP-binding protein
VLRVRNVSLAYGVNTILEDIDLTVAAGKFASLIGPSGSGKTSILRAVTELMPLQRGAIELDVPLSEVGFLFQDDALLPWRTARQNVALGLRIRGETQMAANEEAETWLGRLGLAGLSDRFPRQLSGGQRKRVAIAQVLALEPKLLLMDEPFASLDAIVRMRITQELLDWVEREQMTVLLVTHDLEEAITLSDVVYVLGQGPRATVRARHEVAIPRPRHILETRENPVFARLLMTLWNELSEGSVAVEGPAA